MLGNLACHPGPDLGSGISRNGVFPDLIRDLLGEADEHGGPGSEAGMTY